MSKRIRIGKVEKPASLAKEIESAGFGFGRNADGELVLTVKFPGVDAMDLTREDLGMIVDRLDRPSPNGHGPGAVFARSATEDPDGGMTAKFSDEKRARSVNFTAEDRADVAMLLEAHLDAWEDYTRQLNEVESQAATETSEE